VVKIYRARIFSFPDPEFPQDYKDGFLAVSQEGQIIDYGKWDRNKEKHYKKIAKQGKILDKRNLAILPGFIDVHLHLPQLFLRGHYGKTLLDWLNKYVIPAESSITHPQKLESNIKTFFYEMLRNGTTTSLIFSSSSKTVTDQAFSIARQLSVRAIIGKAMMDKKSSEMEVDSTEKSLSESIDLYEKWNGVNNLLYYAFSPRFAPATSEKLLRSVGKYCTTHSAYVHTHLAETKEEVKLTRKLFPKYKTYTELYYKTGILSPKTIIAHAIHLQESEYELLSKTQSKVAHCPSSNFFLHSGHANTAKMEKYNITIGLGTDVGGGPSFSLFSVMRDAYYVRHMPPSRAFYYATLGGAKALSLDDRIGSLEIGKEADFIVVDYPHGCPKTASTERVMAQLIFRGDDRLIKETYVRGKRIYKKTS